MANLINYKMLINGAWVNASNGKTFNSTNPTTGEIWCSIPESTEADVNNAVESAFSASARVLGQK